MSKEEWKCISGSFTRFCFKNKKTGEEHTIDIEDKIEIPISILYYLIENIDYLCFIRSAEKSNMFPDNESFIDNVSFIRKLLRKKWKEKFTGDLPHLWDEDKK